MIFVLENVIQDELSKSRIVRLEKSGNLYPSLSEGVADPADLTTANIRRVSINYRPGSRIIDSMRAAGFKKHT